MVPCFGDALESVPGPEGAAVNVASVLQLVRLSGTLAARERWAPVLARDGAALLRFLLESALDEELLQATVDLCNQLAEAGESIEGVPRAALLRAASPELARMSPTLGAGLLLS